MTKQKMFLRIITASLVRRRSLMLVALLAIAVGATILSGLVTIYYDVPRQMGAEFRNYGANMILVPSGNDAAFNMDAVEETLGYIKPDQLVGVAPYRYETVRIHEQPIVAAGTDMEGAKATSPYWHINGAWPDAAGDILLGQKVADQLGLKPGDTLTVSYAAEEAEPAAEPKTDAQAGETDQLDAASQAEGQEESGADEAQTTGEDYVPDASLDMTVTGILETGGSEEEYVYLSMEDLNGLTGGSDKLDVVELSVSADQSELEQYGSDIENNVDDVTPRLVKRVTESESTVLTKLQALVFLVTAVVLVLTMICVATTMTAAVTERRKEIGLRKALGASNRSIIGEFMGEGLLLGGVGGLIGAGLGFAFAQAVSMKVFNSSITFQPLLLPVTIIVSVLVAGCACLLPVKSATEVDPAVVLKGE